MLNRAVNEGFSGGEKKRNEIFQMAVLEPKLAILDETDSGLDIDALKIVANGVNALRSPDRAIIVVTHYQRLLNYIVPDFVHVLSDGRIVKSGGKELALELEAEGLRLDRGRRAGAGVGGTDHMAQVAEKLQPWLASLEERPRGGSRWLQDLRDHAASRFAALGFPDGARRGVAVHQRRADRVDRVQARAGRRRWRPTALDAVPLRRRAAPAGVRQRPLLARAVADVGPAGRRAVRLARHGGDRTGRRRRALPRPARRPRTRARSPR